MNTNLTRIPGVRSGSHQPVLSGWLAAAVLGMAATLSTPQVAKAQSSPSANASAAQDLPALSRSRIQPPKPVAFEIRTLVEGLQHPWSMTWLPGGEMLITERAGRLRRVSADFKLDAQPIEGLPPIIVKGQGGLLEVAAHPQVASNGWIYLSYNEPAEGKPDEFGTALMRAKLQGGKLVEQQRLFALSPKSTRAFHFGGRIVFDGKGHLFLTLGDRGEMARAQAPRDHAGSVIRLTDDGRVPADNPYVNSPEQLPEVYSRGNRNIQGAALHPRTGELWTHEHGPQGGDELNIIRAGRNYGWPTITYGVNYVTGTKIGEGTHKEGMEQPLHVWVPSIAVSGMAFYEAQAFPAWKGSLFIGSLAGTHLVRLELDGDRVVREERVITGQVGRIRDVRIGPDGLIYLLTDAPQGKLVRLEPR